MFINGRVKVLVLNCQNRRLSRMTRIARIVEFVYQCAIHKRCHILNRLLIAYLLCKTAYPTHTSLNLQANNPRNPCHPRKSAIQTKKVSILGFPML